MIAKIRRLVQSVLSALSAPIWVWCAHSLWRRSAEGHETWVVSGHRGRAYLDNAAALEDAARQAKKSIIWLANAPLEAELATRGVRTLRRNSWAARRAISKATALIYSHGEDDLDLFLLLLRGKTAPRFYLNHCLNLLKAGGILEPNWNAQNSFVRRCRKWLFTDCDHLLACSDLEKENFARSYPHLADKITLGGGAHLDAWEQGLRLPTRRRIYWFPTFRDHAHAQERLNATISQIITSAPLRDWLRANDYELFIGTHINASPSTADSFRAPFFMAPKEHLVRDISQSELFISDYSGIIFDFLLSERAQILFAFDREDYLEHRCLYLDYDSLDFALHLTTSETLIKAIIEEKWRAPALKAAATRWRNKALPPRTQRFAQESLATIEGLLSAEESAH